MKSQSDIARENQEGIQKANKRESENAVRTEDDRATQFDGNPNSHSAGGLLKPKDDTPLRLKKWQFPGK